MRTNSVLVLVVACVAQLTVVLDASVVNVALPSLRTDLGMGDATASWVVTGYAVGFAGVLLVAARAVDVVGVGRVLGLGTVAFTLASVVAGLANGPAPLLAARVVQGVAAAVVSPASFTLITLTCPEGPRRVRAIAVWTAVSVAGGGVGTVLGGLAAGLGSWRLVFLINLPVGVAVLVCLRVLARTGHLPPATAPGRRIDFWSALSSAVTVGGTVYLFTDLRETGIDGVAAGVLALVSAVLLVRRQRCSADPLIPVDLLRRRTVALGNAATFLSAMCLQSAFWFVLTFRFQDHLGLSATATGLLFLPLTVSMTAANLLLVPWCMAKAGERGTVLLGSAVAVAGLFWMAMVPDAAVAPTVLVGLGGGLVGTPLATLVTKGVPADQQGAASGLMNTAKQFGGAVGLAASVVVTGVAGTDAAAFLLMAGVSVAAALTTAAAVQRPRSPRSSQGGVRPGREARSGR